MKVLVGHNRYRSAAPSGENIMVDREVALLRAAGVYAYTCFRESDSIDTSSLASRAQLAVAPLYSAEGVREFRRLLLEIRPDVVHLHNVFPLLSPWVVRTAVHAEVPVVQTVHNYRHTCVNGLHTRNGQRCDDCLRHRSSWPAVVHGCYRGSRLQSVPMVASHVLHRGTWGLVDTFLALTPFMAGRLQDGGVAAERIRVRPSWVDDVGSSPVPEAGHFLFAGRLDEPKGVRLLLDAWQLGVPGRRLVVVGDGPLRGAVERAAAADPTITYGGSVSPGDVVQLLKGCVATVLPSVYYEGFPLIVAESLSLGRPVVLAEGGSTVTAVPPGAVWQTSLTSTALNEVLRGVTDLEARARGVAARRHYEEHLSPRAGLTSLLDVYEHAQARGAA